MTRARRHGPGQPLGRPPARAAPSRRAARRARPVLWVDPPISRMTPLDDASAAAALREDRLREVAPNIMRLSPVTVPGVTRPVLRELALRQSRRAGAAGGGALGGRGPQHDRRLAQRHARRRPGRAARLLRHRRLRGRRSADGHRPALARAARARTARQGGRRGRVSPVLRRQVDRASVRTSTSSPTGAWRPSSRPPPTTPRASDGHACRRRSPASSGTSSDRIDLGDARAPSPTPASRCC